MVQTARSLVTEKENLMATNEWLTPERVTYAKISIWPELNSMGQFDSYKVQYVLKVKDQDLLKHKYKSKLTHRYNDYLLYVNKLWFDTATWKYQSFRDAAKQIQDMNSNSYLGRCSPVKKFTKNPFHAPNLGHTTTFLWYDSLESEWVFQLNHHDFAMESRTHVNQWNQNMHAWMNKYAIQKEFDKGQIPPAITIDVYF